MDDNMDDNIAMWNITGWLIDDSSLMTHSYSSANSKGEYTAAQSQSTSISRRPITGPWGWSAEILFIFDENVTLPRKTRSVPHPPHSLPPARKQIPSSQGRKGSTVDISETKPKNEAVVFALNILFLRWKGPNLREILKSLQLHPLLNMQIRYCKICFPD